MGRRNPCRNKCKNYKVEKEDRISKLPDAILAEIMSKLSIREIATTSTVSKRWKKLWKETIAVKPSFVFAIDGCQRWKKMAFFDRTVEAVMPEFVNLVNGVINLHTSPTVEEFTIEFPLYSNYSDDIHGWIEFAANKGVKKLKLDIDPERGFIGRLCKSIFMVDTPMKNLKDMYIGGMNVGENVIKFLISNSPYLERLCVVESRSLRKLEVDAAEAPNNLKCLEISRCRNMKRVDLCAPNLNHLVLADYMRLKNVKISAPNLVSFVFGGVLRNPLTFTIPVPPLSNVYLGLHDDAGAVPRPPLINRFRRLLGYVSQVEALRLHMEDEVFDNIYHVMANQFCKFRNLKNLELSFPITCPAAGNIPWPCALVEAAPLLQSLSIKLSHKQFENIDIEDIDFEWMYDNIREKVKKKIRCSHKNLKVVELAGFTGCRNEVVLVLHLVEIGVSLEKITIDVSLPYDYLVRTGGDFLSSADKISHRLAQTCRERAQLLKTQFRPEINVVIL